MPEKVKMPQSGLFFMKGRPTPKKTLTQTKAQFAQTISELLVQIVPPVPFQVSRCGQKEFAHIVCANCLISVGVFFGGVGCLPLIFGVFDLQTPKSSTLRTLTSLNKESRPFFLSDNSIWWFPSVSSLSDYSIWRSRRLFFPCDHRIWSIWVHCPQILVSHRKNG